jgi:hypothetical protein
LAMLKKALIVGSWWFIVSGLEYIFVWNSLKLFE